MGAPVVHFEIMGGNGNELEQFYSQLFEWNINSNNPMQYGVIDTAGTGNIGGGVGPSRDGGKRVTVYVQVEDVQAILDHAEQLGGRTILPPSVVPGGPKLALFCDPAGNVTGIMEGKQDNR